MWIASLTAQVRTPGLQIRGTCSDHSAATLRVIVNTIGKYMTWFHNSFNTSKILTEKYKIRLQISSCERYYCGKHKNKDNQFRVIPVFNTDICFRLVKNSIRIHFGSHVTTTQERDGFLPSEIRKMQGERDLYLLQFTSEVK